MSGAGRLAAAARAAASPRESVALSERALAVVRGLPDHSLIDRLVRARSWIPVLGVLLAGIIAMQVEILKLGSSMGRSVERTARLQTQNEALRASVAGLADDQRIERLAAAMGMTMPRPDALVFLAARPGGAVGRALTNIHAPDPTTFINQLAAQAAAAAALMPPAPASTAPSAAAPGAPAAPSGSTAATPASASAPGTTSVSPASSATPSSTAAPPSAAPSQVPAPTGPAGSTVSSGTAGAAGSAGAAALAAPQPSGTPGG